ncbi:MAG: NAD-dependent succinate-semialdehyde dehydrogenase [Nitrospiraceae bacterium]|nr:MAG: NAD-dependent succinate-semialdehyde dehydrogenase [Nitrospiraceae bacterium]
MNKLYMNGKWIESASGRRFDVLNPASGEVIGQVADGNAKDTQKAIQAAHDACESWAHTLPKDRTQLLSDTARAILVNREHLARVLTQENGKPMHEASSEIAYAADFFTWFSEEAKRVYGRTVPSNVPDRRRMVIKQPVGPVGAITPWNFPLAMIARKVAPALAAGCPVVVKPAEQTPLSAIELFRVFHDSGFPRGTVNLITCSDPVKVGNELLHDERIRKITFTGSAEVGKFIMKECADQLKRVSLELGGNAPVIVFNDANIEKAVQKVVASKFRCAGQTCICPNRIFVQRDIAGTFSETLAQTVKTLRVGDGIKSDTQIGPLIDKQGLEKVKTHVADAVSRGARCLIGGNTPADQALRNGFFFEPTVLVNVTTVMKIFNEETFGPVAPIIAFGTEKEVLEMANSTPYGLSGYVYTNDLGRAFRVSERLECGIVGVNDERPSVPECPFGGLKQSGIGREGGSEGIEEFTETKYISFGID